MARESAPGRRRAHPVAYSPFPAAMLATAMLLAAACDEDTTALHLLVAAAENVETPRELEVTLFDSSGLASRRRIFNKSGEDVPVRLPTAFTVFPPRPGEIRVLVSARSASSIVGQAAGKITVQTGQTVELSLRLGAGKMTDRDRDTVPDVIDSCLDEADPEQRASCPPMVLPDGSAPADAGYSADSAAAVDTR